MLCHILKLNKYWVLRNSLLGIEEFFLIDKTFKVKV